MRNNHAPVEIERFRFVLLNESDRFLCEQIIGEHLGFGRISTAAFADRLDDVRQFYFRFVFPQETGEMVVCMSLIQVSKEVIETVLAR